MKNWIFPGRTQGYNQTATPYQGLLLSEPCWHRVYSYFVYLTVTQAAHCSLFLPQWHLSPITLYYANSSMHGYCSARHQCWHSWDWQLQNMCSMGCHLMQKHCFLSDTLLYLCVNMTQTSHRNWQRLRLYKMSIKNGIKTQWVPPADFKHFF